MNAKIGTSFGLALLMAIAGISTMLALGTFAAKPASADLAAATVTVSPDKARSIGQYTIVVTGATGMTAIPVGGSITITFNTKTTVPSSIAASAIKLKATKISPSGFNTGTANQLVSASSVTVSGRAVTITIPDMDPTTGTGAGGGSGEQGIAANGAVTIIFTHAAGIQNANLASSTLTLTVKTSADTMAVTSGTYTVTSFVSFTPSTAARDSTVTVTGGGFEKDCTTCKIRFSPQNAVAPTTGAIGTGTIDANGVFTGSITLTSSTSAGGYVWITDSAGNTQVSSTTFTQKAGATPRSSTASPGATVSVDLVDFTASGTIANNSTLVGATAAANSGGTSFSIPSTGDTTSLLPYKFVMPTTVSSGTHKVTVTDGSKSAAFNIEVATRVLTVTPATASPGQSITVQGTGFTKSGVIEGSLVNSGSLTATATGGGTAILNHLAGQDISIDATGAFAYATRMPTLGAFASATSESVTVTATDGFLSGSSAPGAFKRTPRTLTLSPAEAGPGSSITVTVTGMTVDNDEAGVAKTANFTISSSGTTLTGTLTFPIGSDGSGTGTFTIPTTQTATTLTITATDNALALNPVVIATKATQNQTAAASLKVTLGGIPEVAVASVGPVQVTSRTVVEYEIQADDVTGVALAQVTYTYDPTAFQMESVVLGPDFGGCFNAVNDDGLGTSRWR